MIDDSSTLVLHPRRARWLLLLVASLAFTVAGVAMIRGGEIQGWFILAVFGLGTVVSGAQLRPSTAYLRLTPDGFEIRTLFRHLKIRWADVSWFRTGRIGFHTMVLFDYAPSYRRSVRARAVATALTGAEAGLPDTYGHSADALVALLNEWRARATLTTAR